MRLYMLYDFRVKSFRVSGFQGFSVQVAVKATIPRPESPKPEAPIRKSGKPICPKFNEARRLTLSSKSNALNKEF